MKIFMEITSSSKDPFIQVNMSQQYDLGIQISP